MDRNNPDSAAFTNPSELKGHVNLRKAAPGENGAERGRKFSITAAAGDLISLNRKAAAHMPWLCHFMK